MAALSTGLTFAAAAAHAMADDPDFDLGANLTMLVEANVVVGFHRQESTRTPVLWHASP